MEAHLRIPDRIMRTHGRIYLAVDDLTKSNMMAFLRELRDNAVFPQKIPRKSGNKDSLKAEYCRLLREHDVNLKAIGMRAGIADSVTAGDNADDGEGVAASAFDMAEDIWQGDFTIRPGIYINLRRTV
jgi:hypothetical protein